jgi:hypothetical protein
MQTLNPDVPTSHILMLNKQKAIFYHIRVVLKNSFFLYKQSSFIKIINLSNMIYYIRKYIVWN